MRASIKPRESLGQTRWSLPRTFQPRALHRACREKEGRLLSAARDISFSFSREIPIFSLSCILILYSVFFSLSLFFIFRVCVVFLFLFLY